MSTSTMTDTQILSRLRELLADTFDIDPTRVTPEADLYRDLDLDSIDAVDLVVRLKELTGKRMQPEVFKSVRTVQDVVNALAALLGK